MGRLSPTERRLLHLWRGTFRCQLSRSQRQTQGPWQSWYRLGWPWWFLSSGACARGRGNKLCAHLKGSPCRSMSEGVCSHDSVKSAGDRVFYNSTTHVPVTFVPVCPAAFSSDTGTIF